MLLRYANHQLQQLAVRYRLERLPESLNLIVIDRDMEVERRSIHSLSGGESFLVSLALALGLASLTSNRVRIESLFIDEGFLARRRDDRSNLRASKSRQRPRREILYRKLQGFQFKFKFKRTLGIAST